MLFFKDMRFLPWLCITVSLIPLLISAREQLDEILVRVAHESGSTVVTVSDIKPALDGTVQTLSDIVMDMLMLYDALSLKMQATMEDAERYVEAVLRQSGQTRSQLLEQFEKVGYDYTQALEMLRRMQTQAQIFEHRVSANPRTLITQQEVQAAFESSVYLQLCDADITQAMLQDWHDAHTQTLLTETVHGDNPVHDWQNVLHMALKDDAFIQQMQWSEPFYVMTDELPEERMQASNASAESIVFIDPLPAEDDVIGFTITKLIEQTTGIIDKESRRPLTIQEATPQISHKLRMHKIRDETKKYYTRLFDNASLIFTYPQDKQSVLKQIQQDQF